MDNSLLENFETKQARDLVADDLGRWVQVRSDDGANVVLGELHAIEFTQNFSSSNGRSLNVTLQVGRIRLTVNSLKNVHMEQEE